MPDVTTEVGGLADVLRTHGIVRAVVIDDAFDVGIAEMVSDDGQRTFAAELKRDPAIATELGGIGVDPTAVLNKNGPALVALAGNLDKLVAARPHVETLLYNYLDRRGLVDDLVRHLKALQLEVVELGAEQAIPGDLQAQIAFIDFYLDDQAEGTLDEPPEDGDPSENARKKARAMYDQSQAFIVLMSSREGVAQEEAAFRKRARLLRGYFKFHLKSSLSDEPLLHECLAAMPLTAEFRHTLHAFIDRLDQRSKAIAEIFVDEIRDLGLEDYAQLRQLSLNKDGHPFGDYIIRLFGHFLTSLVLQDQELARHILELDATTFNSLLPVRAEPSATLGRIYLASLTEKRRHPITHHAAPQAAEVQAEATAPVGATHTATEVRPIASVESAPTAAPAEVASTQALTTAQAEAASASEATDAQTAVPAEAATEAVLAPTEVAPNVAAAETAPPKAGTPTLADAATTASAPAAPLLAIELGDLFVKDATSPIFAVMNPACDLALGAKRAREPGDAVLLIPGTLRQLYESYAGSRPPTMFTPLYEMNGSIFRIDWDYRRLWTVAHKDIPEKLLANGYHCDSRLQLGPALELQQHFASSISRVGLPVPPPIRRSHDATLRCRGIQGEWGVIGAPLTAAVLALHMRDKDEFIITKNATKPALEAMRTHLGILKAASPDVPWNGSGNRAKYVRDLEKAFARWTAHFPFHHTTGSLPGGRHTEKTWNKKLIEVAERFGVARSDEVFAKPIDNAETVLVVDLSGLLLDSGTGVEDLPREMEET